MFLGMSKLYLLDGIKSKVSSIKIYSGGRKFCKHEEFISSENYVYIQLCLCRKNYTCRKITHIDVQEFYIH